MKGKWHFAALALVQAACLTAAGPGQRPEPDFRVAHEAQGTSSHVTGKRFSFWIQEEDLQSSPTWGNPEADPPPVSISQAIVIAKRELAKYTSDPEKWTPTEVTLRSLGKHSNWYYVIEWKPDRHNYTGDGICIPVLMTGKAVNVKVEVEPDEAGKKPNSVP